MTNSNDKSELLIKHIRLRMSDRFWVLSHDYLYFLYAFEDGANIKSNNVGVIMAETRTANSIKILALETLRFRKRFLYNLVYLGF